MYDIIRLRVSPFGAGAWWTDWPSDFLRGIDCFVPLSMVSNCRRLVSELYLKGGLQNMLSFREIIAVISLCIACISLGYKIGHDISSKNTDKKQE